MELASTAAAILAAALPAQDLAGAVVGGLAVIGALVVALWTAVMWLKRTGRTEMREFITSREGWDVVKEQLVEWTRSDSFRVAVNEARNPLIDDAVNSLKGQMGEKIREHNEEDDVHQAAFLRFVERKEFDYRERALSALMVQRFDTLETNISDMRRTVDKLVDTVLAIRTGGIRPAHTPIVPRDED